MNNKEKKQRPAMAAAIMWLVIAALIAAAIKFFGLPAAAASLLSAIIVYIFMSITQKRKLREQQEKADILLAQSAQEAKSANRAKSEFLSRMSHDIRTPISGILGMTCIASNNITDTDRVLDSLKKIEGASHHLLTFINDILDMSRIESGKVRHNNEPFDIRNMLDACCSITAGQLVYRDVELIREYDQFEHPRLIGDELHLRQILINILSNSVKFTGEGDKIIIRAKELSSRDGKALYHFELEDTGIGMKKEFLPKLFDEFSQEYDGGRTNYPGTGLGMSITKKFVELLDGSIEVESEPDVGTKFTLEFMIDINTQQNSEHLGAYPDVSIDGMNILMAEDNELNAEIARDILQDAGAVITTARNGKEALDIFCGSEVYSFDAILMDIMMPETDGITATRTIRAMEREDAASIPIIAMTANTYEEDVRKTREAGMNAHLSKPIDVEMMLRTLRNIYLKKDTHDETRVN